MPIRRLSPSLVNKIAAGEVIERPASVVKELVENAIDAGATRIDVAIEQGGGELVRVVDNGGGIPADELPLAVASHATSKLAEADDLFRIRTLGFRGEALASIAEISRLTLKCRPPECDAGATLEVVGGEAGPVAPCGCPPGTQIEVRSLFFNTPVRRKFLKSTTTESGHVAEAIVRVALAQPGVHFTLQHNQRQVYDLPPVADVRQRITALFGDELGSSLIPVESVDGDIRLAGCVADPSQSRSNNRLQYLFLNGRHIRDRSLQHALSEAYRGLLLTGRYPIAFLYLELPPELVDVNVHPTKLEVRFQDGGRIYSQLLATLRTKFLQTDLTARGRAPTDDKFTRPPFSSPPYASPSPAAADATALARQLELVEWAKASLVAQGVSLDEPAAPPDSSVSPPLSPPLLSPLSSLFPLERRPLELVPIERITTESPDDDLYDSDEDDDEPEIPDEVFAEISAAATAAATAVTGDGKTWRFDAPRTTALQIHNRYLITESVDGVVVIDQHALHERVIYEHLRARVLAGAVETQVLLVPEPVDLAPAEAAAVLEHAPTLEQIGVRLAPFGGGTVLVSSYPAMLRRVSPGELVRELATQLATHGKTPDRRDVLDELLHMMSCKAAVKAGDPLTPQEIDALLAQRHLAQDAHHCPHGRPTALVFTREELDRQFKRT